MNFPEDLQIGDICLYSTRDLTDEVIELKEGDDIAHIEIYMGNNVSWASRNGIGVNAYPFRPEGLKYVLRPIGHFNEEVATSWFNDGVKGLPYGFGDILESINIKNNLKGVDCSHFAASLLEIAQVPLFNSWYPKNKITPRDFKMVKEAILICSL
jgi:hypothetical protein